MKVDPLSTKLETLQALGDEVFTISYFDRMSVGEAIPGLSKGTEGGYLKAPSDDCETGKCVVQTKDWKNPIPGGKVWDLITTGLRE